MLREAQVNGEDVLVRDAVGNRSLIVFGAGDEISVQAGEEGVRFLLVSGRPLREPVAWHGPIVMNTRGRNPPGADRFAHRRIHQGLELDARTGWSRRSRRLQPGTFSVPQPIRLDGTRTLTCAFCDREGGDTMPGGAEPR